MPRSGAWPGSCACSTPYDPDHDVSVADHRRLYCSISGEVLPQQLPRRATRGERLVFERLHELDDSWIVLPSVSFVAQERRVPALGRSTLYYTEHPKSRIHLRPSVACKRKKHSGRKMQLVQATRPLGRRASPPLPRRLGNAVVRNGLM
jgi:hypothetical protein